MAATLEQFMQAMQQQQAAQQQLLQQQQQQQPLGAPPMQQSASERPQLNARSFDNIETFAGGEEIWQLGRGRSRQPRRVCTACSLT